MSDAPVKETGSTTEQDSWLSSTLGLDLGKYAGGAAGTAQNTDKAEEADGGILDTIKAGAEQLAGVVTDTVAAAGGVVTDTVAAVGQAVTGAVAAVSETVTDVVKAVGKAFAGPPVIPRAELGTAQTGRADKLLKAMPPADQVKVQALLDKASPAEKKYLQKAVASSHSAAEMDAFYKKIAGKDEAWMEQNLHVVGKGKGKGIKQQWHDSCAPTTVQAMKAELDPVYALKLREESPKLTQVNEDDATDINPKLAAEQRKILEKHGGVAVDRDDVGGAGIMTVEALNDTTGTTGLEFETHVVKPTTVDKALTDIDTAIANGLPVPLSVGDDTGGHAVLVTGMDPGPPRRYSIHDPWDGKIVVVTDKQLKDGTFDIAGWTKLKKVFKPTAKDPAP